MEITGSVGRDGDSRFHCAGTMCISTELYGSTGHISFHRLVVKKTFGVHTNKQVELRSTITIQVSPN